MPHRCFRRDGLLLTETPLKHVYILFYGSDLFISEQTRSQQISHFSSHILSNHLLTSRTEPIGPLVHTISLGIVDNATTQSRDWLEP